MKRWIVGLGAANLVLVAAIVAVLLSPIRANAEGTGIVTVTSGHPLNVRSGPSTYYPLVGTLPPGVALQVRCQVAGEMVEGDVRSTSTWNRLVDDSYVSDAYIAWPSATLPAPCSQGATANVGEFLNARTTASTGHDAVRQIGPGEALDVTCQLGGEEVTGTGGTSALWDRLSDGTFVADAFVGWLGQRPAVSWCDLHTEDVPAIGEPFIEWAAPMAQEVALDYKVPASVTLAQAIHETGWGTDSLSTQGNALFGKKCYDGPGPVAVGCRTFGTFECEPGCYDTSASFRVYGSFKDSFIDHGIQLTTLDRYAPAFAFVNDPDQFAAQIHQAGYATDPTYTDKLIALMRKYDLYRFDLPL